MDNLKLGQLIDKDTQPQRDAIHIAVISMIAGEDLLRGTWVGVSPKQLDVATSVVSGNDLVGIVDPSLPPGTHVKQGERFWMWMRPGSITSIRHEWTHPAFEPAPFTLAAGQASAKKWIEQFADDIGQGYKSLMTAAHRWYHSEEYTYDNSESYKDVAYDKWSEFWKYYAIVTGQEDAKDKDQSFFTCSC